jgi:hypothetical protein
MLRKIAQRAILSSSLVRQVLVVVNHLEKLKTENWALKHNNPLNFILKIYLKK